MNTLSTHTHIARLLGALTLTLFLGGCTHTKPEKTPPEPPVEITPVVPEEKVVEPVPPEEPAPVIEEILPEPEPEPVLTPEEKAVIERENEDARIMQLPEYKAFEAKVVAMRKKFDPLAFRELMHPTFRYDFAFSGNVRYDIPWREGDDAFKLRSYSGDTLTALQRTWLYTRGNDKNVRFFEYAHRIKKGAHGALYVVWDKYGFKLMPFEFIDAVVREDEAKSILRTPVLLDINPLPEGYPEFIRQVRDAFVKGDTFELSELTHPAFREYVTRVTPTALPDTEKFWLYSYDAEFSHKLMDACRQFPRFGNASGTIYWCANNPTTSKLVGFNVIKTKDGFQLLPSEIWRHVNAPADVVHKFRRFNMYQ